MKRGLAAVVNEAHGPINSERIAIFMVNAQLGKVWCYVCSSWLQAVRFVFGREVGAIETARRHLHSALHTQRFALRLAQTPPNVLTDSTAPPLGPVIALAGRLAASTTHLNGLQYPAGALSSKSKVS